MLAVVVRRVASGALLVVVLTFLTFFVFNEIPTNPACLVVACGPHTTTSDADIRAADHQLGIDRSVFVQYGDFLWRLVRHGDLGTTWTDKSNVGQRIGDALPATTSLVAGGMILMLLLALPLGAVGAIRHRAVADRGILALSVIGLAIHPFVLGVTLRDFFANQVGVPDIGYCPLTAHTPNGCGGPRDWATHLAIPWLVFALFFLPIYVRMVRVRLLETLNEPWMTTARAKGASEWRALYRHALRNAVTPVVPMIAIDAGTAITAAIYVETVFGLNGIGLLAVQALSGQLGGYDLPLIAGIVAVVGAFVVLLSIAADIATAWLDPRIQTRAVSGLIPLPPSVATRPRVRLTLNFALAVAVVTLIGLAATRGGGSHRPPHLNIGAPVRTLNVRWSDSYRLQTNFPPIQTGALKTKVTQIELGSNGWRVRATITNDTSIAVPVTNFPGSTYPRQGMSLLTSAANGFGGQRIEVHPATVIIPPLPKQLAPHQLWQGTFGSEGRIMGRTVIYVGFGQFSWNQASISLATQSSAIAPR